MVKLPSKWFALLGSALIGAASAAYAQDSGPLVDLLVRKGLINDQEAEDLRVELTRDFGSTPAGKLNLSSSLTELRLAGDVRVRWEERGGELMNGDNLERGRFRYRFRTALTGRLLNDWSFGFRLETGSGNRSSNVTMGTDGGPFGKSDDGIYIGQIYATYTPTPAFSATIGRMPNPLVSTSMIWDGDINPEGLAETYRTRRDKTEYFFTAGQFLYGGSNTRNPFGSGKVNDTFLLAWQGGVKYSFDASSLQIAPTIYQYVGADQSKNASAFRGAFGPSNPAGINDLFIINVPVEYSWKVKDVPVRAYADIALNLDAEERARKYGRPDLDGEDMAYSFGVQYGKAANKGEWDVRVGYQSVEAFSLDANLVDSDIFDSRTNMEGFVVSGNYALGAATMLSLTVANADRVTSSLNAPGAGDVGSNNALKDYWLFQADLNLKF